MTAIQYRHYEIHDLLDGRQTTGPISLARHFTDFRIDDLNAAIPQCPKIGLDGRVLPHARVHGRRNHNRRGNSQMECGQEVVGKACCQSRDTVGSRGRHKEQIRGLRNQDMIERAFEIATGIWGFKDVDVDLIAWQRSKGEWGDELGRAFGH